MDFVAAYIDGVGFGDTTVVVAMGVTKDGEKKILGIIEGATEPEGISAFPSSCLGGCWPRFDWSLPDPVPSPESGVRPFIEDPLGRAKFFLPAEEQDRLDLAQTDLGLDVQEAVQAGHSVQYQYAVLWIRQSYEFTLAVARAIARIRTAWKKPAE